MTQTTDPTAVRELPPVPEGQVRVVGDVVVFDGETLEDLLADYASAWKVSLDIVQLSGPGGGNPVIAMTGEPARVAFALVKYTGAGYSAVLQAVQDAEDLYFGDETGDPVVFQPAPEEDVSLEHEQFASAEDVVALEESDPDSDDDPDGDNLVANESEIYDGE
jgi:hypothetical protein